MPVLICDDNQEVVNTLQAVLASSFERVEGFISTQELLDNWQIGQQGLVIMDLLQPNLSGHQAIKKLQQIDLGVPVIALSGTSLPLDAAKAIEIGARTFVPKPIDFAALVQVLKEQESFHNDRQKCQDQLGDLATIYNSLTKSERETFVHAMQHGSVKHTAQATGTSIRTIESYRLNIAKKADIGPFSHILHLLHEFQFSTLRLGIDPTKWLQQKCH